MKWVKMTLGEIALGIYDGPHATPKESESGPIFLGIRNITEDGHLDLTDIKHISVQEYNRWIKRVKPKEHDIVFTYEATLHRYARYASPTYADGTPLPQGHQPPTPFLSDDERRLLEQITDPIWNGPRRIEQERIPLQTAHEELTRCLSHRQSM